MHEVPRVLKFPEKESRRKVPGGGLGAEKKWDVSV